MENQYVNAFNIIGISLITSNAPGKAEQDIPALWSKFWSEDILSKIPNKIDNRIYCIYTDYEGDHTMPYRVVLGCKIADVDKIPEGMIEHRVANGGYHKFVAKGAFKDNIVFNEWLKIWNADLDRVYHSDFEVYDERSQDMENAEVDIYIGVKPS